MNRLGVFLISVLVVNAVADEPTTDDALRYLYMAWATYCDPARVQAWDCYWCQSVSDFTVTGIINNPDTNTFGYMGVNSVTQEIFRGTEWNSIANLISDLNLGTTSPFGDQPGVEVHSGFLNAYLSVQTQLVSLISTANPKYPITFVGHSLGGALATLAATDFSAIPGLQISNINFGCPRVGNAAFAAYYATFDIQQTWRFVHQNDIVPHLPALALGYQHVPRELWSDDPNRPQDFILCDESGEDPDCADSVPITSLSGAAHFEYLGVPVKESPECGQN